MQNANIRDKPIDLRNFDMKDRETLRAAGTSGKRENAVKRVKAYRGAIRKRHNAPPNTTKRRPGGGFTQGVTRQHQRLREKGAEVRKSKALRPPVNDVYTDLYN